jgi:hypothetical protein
MENTETPSASDARGPVGPGWQRREEGNKEQNDGNENESPGTHIFIFWTKIIRIR